MPLVAFTALDGTASLGFRIGVAMNHRPRWIFQGQRLTRVNHVGRETLHRYLRCTFSHTDLTPRFIQHGITTSRKFGVGERNRCLVIHERPAFEVDLVIGRVMQLHVLRSRELRQSARVSHHFVDKHITGGCFWLFWFVWFVRHTLRVLFARCTATRIGREMPLVAFTALDGSASLGFRVSVAMDHRTRWIFQGQLFSLVRHIEREIAKPQSQHLLVQWQTFPLAIKHGVMICSKGHVRQADHSPVIDKTPALE